MALDPGTRLGRYEIRSRLGAGGMGEVYLAEDTKLDRKIALKILPTDVASNKDRMARFVREAKSAAALNHPNIAHVYEIGESAGVNFIAMELVDGHTLRELIYAQQTDLVKLLRRIIVFGPCLRRIRPARRSDKDHQRTPRTVGERIHFSVRRSNYLCGTRRQGTRVRTT